MKAALRTLCMFVTVALAGCATVSMPLAPNVAAASPGTHIVTVQRDSSMMPIAINPIAVYVDGAPVVTLGNGRAVDLHLTDGRHLIGIAAAVRAVPKQPTQEIAVDVSATSQPVLRAHYVAAGWGGIEIEPVEAAH